MSWVYKEVKLKLFQKKWRKLNKHNFIIPENIFDYNQVTIGIGTAGYIGVSLFGNKDEKLIIGNYCSIAPNVKFLLGGEHNINNLTTFEFSKLDRKSVV